MAMITSSERFDADRYSGLVVGIATRAAQHDSGLHQHSKDQLAFAVKGCTSITLDGLKSVLPPMRAAWIPGGTAHRAQMTNVTDYRSLYFASSLQERLPRKLMIIDVNPLLRELIHRMAFWPFDMPDHEQIHALNLFIEELNNAKETPLNLPLPNDYRLKYWLETINHEDFVAPRLNELSKQVGASSKTISRIFQKDTGMSYQSWRQQWRLLSAIELLSKEVRVNEVADRLNFSSDSAFISFFRQQTGCTPTSYCSHSMRIR